MGEKLTGLLTWETKPLGKGKFETVAKIDVTIDGTALQRNAPYGKIRHLNLGTRKSPLAVIAEWNMANDLQEVTLPQVAVEVADNPEKEEWQDPAANFAGAKFHNPYNFVPTYPPATTQLGGISQGAPVGHAAYFDDHYSGTIDIDIEVKTPLLLPDTSMSNWNNGHQTVQSLQGCALKPTQLKGAIRSAYEAITNSRFGVLGAHERRFGNRMETHQGLRLKPARVNDKNELEIYEGAAWLPRYDASNIRSATSDGSAAMRYTKPSMVIPAHGDHVVCWVQKANHLPRNFPVNIVREIAKHDTTMGYAVLSDVATANDTFQQIPIGNNQFNRPPRQVTGYVFISNRNIGHKHDERVFFNLQSTIAITYTVKELWADVIADYKNVNSERQARRKRDGQPEDQYIGDGFGEQAFSRHLIDTDSHMELKEGTMCYVSFDQDRKISGLYPVNISRYLMEKAPSRQVDPKLTSAKSFAEFSAADRVFGWVKNGSKDGDDGRTAYKGQLRVSAITCHSPDGGIDPLDPHIPLAILAAPKPQQTRFYGAKDEYGLPVANGLSKQETGYGNQNVKFLRGRKIYPHQPQWSNVATAPWRRVGETKDSQNRSIKDWIKVGTKFTAQLQVTNLNLAELGGLLWLLNLGNDNNHFLKLGGGKPLGFGSVKVTIKSLDLRDGEAKRADFLSLARNSTGGKRLTGATSAIVEFKKQIEELYGRGKTFDEVRFIKAFVNACKGPEGTHPVQYPLLQDGDQIFQWFGANERGGKLALPPLWNLAPLPRNPN